MTHEESEEIHNQLSKLENQFNELSDRLVKNIDLINTQRQMEQNIDHEMEKLQNSILTMILHTLDERFPKGDIERQGNLENGYNKLFNLGHTWGIFKQMCIK
jgi:hypothetical protein